MFAGITEQILVDGEACAPMRARSDCAACARACPTDALALFRPIPVVSDGCLGCGRCAAACPVGAINVKGFGEVAEPICRGTPVYVDCVRAPPQRIGGDVIVMRFGQIITGLWSNYEGMEAYWLALRSPLFHIEIWGGFIVPAFLMATKARRSQKFIQSLAALLFLAGIFADRVELLIMGQTVPLLRGSFDGFAEYWPSATEWMLAPAGLGIFLFLYGAGNWLLRLSDAPNDSSEFG